MGVCSHVQLLDDVLDMEKVDSGRLAFRPQPCSVIRVLEQCTRGLHDTARLRGVTLSFRAFESRRAAVAELYSGPWRHEASPRLVPHEGVPDIVRYLPSAHEVAGAGVQAQSPEFTASFEPFPRATSDTRARAEAAATVAAASAFEFTLDMTSSATGAPGSPASTPRDLSRVAEFGSCDALVTADPQRLQQVFFNVIMNAIRASEPGGAVLVFVYTVRCGADAVQYCFGVRDCGHGMDAERAAAVGIEPRQESLPSAVSSFHGRAGLGLSFSKGVVQVSAPRRCRIN